MKTYFAKYLPVEGEIKVGDIKNQGYYYSPKEGILKCNNDTLFKEEFHRKQSFDIGFRKVRLFLCSKDVQVGDKLVRNGYPSKGAIWDVLKTRADDKFKVDGLLGWYSLEELQQDFFKVIAPISEEVTWVKEGNEFDEEEIKVTKLCRDSPDNWQYACMHCSSKRECRNDEGDIVKIKCSQCATWH